MKIYEYYRITAKVNLNSSIIAIFPAILIVIGNLLYFRNNAIMALTLPFILYSFICFLHSLLRMKQSILIEKNMQESIGLLPSVLDTSQLLVVFLNIVSPRLILYFPDGHMAGELRKYNASKRKKVYSLSDSEGREIGFFEVKGRKLNKIEVYNEKNIYLGYLERKKQGMMKKDKKELFDASGRLAGAIEGSPLYMDEQILDSNEISVVRLRRGWMPMEWCKVFPDPNTPVLSFKEKITEQNKLLKMSILINEFFIER
jgi:hypothetical protein